MKLKNLIALAAVAAVAAPAFADLSATEDLTSRGGDLVKNRWGECVTVNANKGLRDCGVQAPEPAPPVMEMQREVITLGTDTYFDFDKSNLKPAGKQALQDLAGQLNQRGANIQKITVVGHTDSKGTDAYNQKLSERRASTVANYLAENGVSCTTRTCCSVNTEHRRLIHPRFAGVFIYGLCGPLKPHTVLRRRWI